MAKPVGIGPRSFRTQKSALEHYKALLHRYQDGDRISDPGDHADLVALVERYDPILGQVGEPAKGCGQIGHFERRLNTGTGWSNSGFWVVRLDGSATDFSYIWAVKGLTGDRSKDFYGACRETVALDLVLAKKRAFAEHGDAQGLVACELTGVMISTSTTPTWFTLGPTSLISSVASERPGPGQVTSRTESCPPQLTGRQPTFVEKAIADAFRNYHHNQAMLRILSKSANLQTASQARRPKIALPIRLL
jgi:hypothetical protein